MSEKVTFDMEEAAEDFEAKAEELEQDAQELREELGDGDTEPWQTDEGERIEEEYAEVKSRLNGLREYIEEWGDTEFVVKRLKFGQTMTIKDEVRRGSYTTNDDGEVEGLLREGFYKVATLREAVVEAPSDASDDPANYPLQVGLWLYDEVDALNTVSGVELGNLWEENEGSE